MVEIAHEKCYNEARKARQKEGGAGHPVFYEKSGTESVRLLFIWLFFGYTNFETKEGNEYEVQRVAA